MIHTANDIENQAAFYADQITRTGSKTLRFFPLKGRSNAAPNQFRFEVLRRLVPGRVYGLSRKAQLTDLEQSAIKHGFEIIEVDPADYDRSHYRDHVKQEAAA